MLSQFHFLSLDPSSHAYLSTKQDLMFIIIVFIAIVNPSLDKISSNPLDDYNEVDTLRRIWCGYERKT